jgi:aminotransferase
VKKNIARHVVSLPKSGIRDFFEIVSKMKDVISLGIGEPDFDTPWHIREAAIYALEKGKTHYTSNLGTIELRREICKYVEKNYAVSYKPETDVIITVGVSEAIDLALRALINPGDGVLFHEPCYVSYSPSIALAFGEAIPIVTRAQDGFSLNVEDIAKAWKPNCKVLMMNLPCNPTGGTCDLERLQAIAKFAVEKDLIILSDEIYSELVYDGIHTSIASLPGMKERTLFLHGFSKAFAMTGFRIGYACGHPDLIEAMMKIHQYSMLCAPILAQEAALEALLHGEDGMKVMRDQYHRRRDLVVRRFREAGLSCHLPKAAFYAFPNIVATGVSERDFSFGLLEAEKVAVVPGTAFGQSGTGFVRASFATSYEQLIEACDRIERYTQNLASKRRT